MLVDPLFALGALKAGSLECPVSLWTAGKAHVGEELLVGFPSLLPLLFPSFTRLVH